MGRVKITRTMQLRMMHYYELDSALNTLQRGGNILFPTDTVWGIGCNACDETAVRKVQKIKQRDNAKPFIVLVDSMEMLKKYVVHVQPRIETLLHYHRRPITVIYEQAKHLAQSVLATDGSVAIRITQDEACKKLIQSFGKPIIATAAKYACEELPSTFSEINLLLKEQVDLVFDTSTTQSLDAPSVIVKLSRKGELEFVRE